MNLQLESKRCVFLDYAKASAIILMVLLHTTSAYDSLSKIVGAFHMAVFFVIGGVFFNIKKSTFNTILKKGFIQLIIPYISFSFLALSICWISPYLHPELYPGLDNFYKIFKAALLGIFVGQDYYSGYSFMPLGPLWFLLSLFWCRIVMYLWLAGPHKYMILTRLGIISLLCLIYLEHPLFMSIDGMAVSFPFFAIGFYARNFIKKLSDYKIQIRIIIFIICLSLLCIAVDSKIIYGGGVIEGNCLVAYLRGLAGVVFIIVACSFLPSSFKFLALLGASTITVLGLHFHFIIPAKVIYALFIGDVNSIHIIYAIIVSLVTAYCLTFVHAFLSNKAPFIIGKLSMERFNSILGVKRPSKCL